MTICGMSAFAVAVGSKADTTFCSALKTDGKGRAQGGFERGPRSVPTESVPGQTARSLTRIF